MIELPDGKVSRTLPEQVGFLSEKVREIFKFIDGINVQDNVVAVENIDTPLTAKELVIVNRDVAFLVYSGQLYIKKSVSGSTVYFDVVFSISAGTTITFNSSEIQVNLSNGGMSLVSNSPATYSKAQIDTLLSAKADITYVDAQLALKANLSGANFTGDITAPSIIETMSGYSFYKEADAYTTLVYVGACKNGNKLTLVVFGQINPTADLSEGTLIKLGTFYIPSTVSAKLYPYAQDWITNLLGCKDIKAYKAVNNGVNCNAIIIKNASGSLTARMYNDSTLANGQSYNFRVEFTFLLSDNLAS